MIFNFKSAALICLMFFVFSGCKEKDEIDTRPEKTFPISSELELELYRQHLDLWIDGAIRYSDAMAIDSLHLSTIRTLKSLKGIEVLGNLRSLVIYNIQLDSLDLSKNTKLQYLSCITTGPEEVGRTLLYLNVKNVTALKYLHCGSNLITTLDLSDNKSLTELHCSDNPNLKELDVSNNTMLEVLNASFVTSLRKLDVSKNLKLRKISCDSTLLTELDMSMLPDLKSFNCQGTNIATLKLKSPEKLEELYITDSKISAVDFNLFPNINSLTFGSNLTSVDLKPLKLLKILDCFRLKASEIDLSANTNLELLSIRLSNFKNLDLTKNSNLKTLFLFEVGNLTSLDLRNNTNIVSFGSYYNDGLKTICVSKIPESTDLKWNKDRWSEYVVCE